MHVIYTCGLLWALLQLGNGLLLGAFNIEMFGQKKFDNKTVMDYINQIVHRYDIILIQEVRDVKNILPINIMDYINQVVPGEYNYTMSKPLGESPQKETYLFLYRKDTVSVVATYAYPNDSFSRPPFVVKFSIKNQANSDFVLIPLHAKPGNAVREVDALYDVYDYIQNKWDTKDILLLGDFNADCDYVRAKDWNDIRLFTDKSFHWLISNVMDTTVAGRKCAYDRIVSTKEMMERVKDSAAVYNYKVALGLDQETALKVSNHFPVEVTLTTL